ncbi:tetratricopeptide repeat protein [Algoriphagus sediminis]|uniref:Tetratricopeptide repeat protein n=1 Tax=Algoriphagus sediminis TaxID=3057113 RepID=A0ABT7YD06_9BACT|nr:tetratricopeptide repeat protein [Algoriphagus sediminis]MDN3204358.1 tetratricopeptide repeat protein [Algoriphagus sediminis]
MKTLPSLIGILVLSFAIASCKPDVSPGDKFFAQGKYEEAIKAYTEKLEFSKNDVKVLYNRGRAYEELDNYEMAERDFQNVLDLEPNNFQALLSLSNLNHKEKKYTTALLYANKAADISGAPAMASFMKARAQHQLGDTKEALKSYGQAIQIDKEFGQAYYNRGLLKVATGRIGAACEDFQLALALEYPGSKEAQEKYCR